MKKLFLAAVSTLLLQGCASSFLIGEEEFACPGLPKGVVCAGARKITELTDNNENLDAYVAEQQLLAQKQETSFLDWDWLIGKDEKDEDPRPILQAKPKGEVVYVERNNNPIPDKYIPKTPAEAMAQAKIIKNAQALGIAPNTRAVLMPAKVMRIYVAPYEDQSGSLNMPGYVYVEVQKRRWTVGAQAQKQPANITPLQIRTRSLEEAKKNKKPKTDGLDVLKLKG